MPKRTQILSMLVEGMSMRAVADVSRNTVDKLLRDVGAACLAYQDEHLRGLPCKRVQCDEIWSFVAAKQKNVPENRKGEFGVGDVWTWAAIDADTKLVPCWHVGERHAGDAMVFMEELAARLASRTQLTTDGHYAYLEAVEAGFGGGVDYAMLVKIYGPAPKGFEGRYSQSECKGAGPRPVQGNPNTANVRTSHVERQDLTMRMSIRRSARLTNAFSKKVENHMHAISLHYMHYNFARIHKSLRVTPAQEAGVTDHVWSMEEIAALADPRPGAGLR